MLSNFRLFFLLNGFLNIILNKSEYINCLEKAKADQLKIQEEKRLKDGNFQFKF
jgi:hypothetical protein